MIRMPPGLVFLGKVVPNLLFASYCVTFAAKILLNAFSRNVVAAYYGFMLPGWLVNLLALLSLASVVYIRSCWRNFKERQEMERLGAQPVPIMRGKLWGNIDILLGRLKDGKESYPFEVVDKLSVRYGKIFNTKILGENRIVSCDPNHVKVILTKDFENWEKGPKFRFQMGSVLGSGVFNSDGTMWQFHRSMTRPFFSRERISDFDTFYMHADAVVDVLRAAHENGIGVNFQDLAMRFTLDSASEFLFGHCVHSLEQVNLGGNDAIYDALGRLGAHLARRSRTSPLWPFFELFKDRTSADMTIVNDFIHPIIQDALNRKKRGEASAEPSANDTNHGTLLDDLIRLTNDPELIADEVINILFAGRDTTASTVTFLVYLLSMHPGVLSRLRQEITNLVGLTKYPTFDDVRNLKYLRACINETLRLFPAVPGNVRTAIKATVLPASTPGEKPFYIPAGTKVPYAMITIQRSKEYWGPDADEFDPDRFLDARLQKYLIPNPFIFLPFSAGPRICLGQQFAYQEISVLVVRLLQTFDTITLAPDHQPPESFPPTSWATAPGRKGMEKIRPKSELNMSIQGGLWVRMRHVEN